MNSLQSKTRFQLEARRLSRWLLPGMGVKRWMFMILAGITLLGVSLAVFIDEFYNAELTNPVLLDFFSIVSLQFLPRLVRVIIFAGLGIGLVVYGIGELNRSGRKIK